MNVLYAKKYGHSFWNARRNWLFVRCRAIEYFKKAGYTVFYPRLSMLLMSGLTVTTSCSSWVWVTSWLLWIFSLPRSFSVSCVLTFGWQGPAMDFPAAGVLACSFRFMACRILECFNLYYGKIHTMERKTCILVGLYRMSVGYSVPCLSRSTKSSMRCSSCGISMLCGQCGVHWPQSMQWLACRRRGALRS